MNPTETTCPRQEPHNTSLIDRDPVYASMNASSLMDRIVNGDFDAHHEWVTYRTPLRVGGREVDLLTWVDHAKLQKPADWRGGDQILETAHDLWVDRFTRLPPTPPLPLEVAPEVAPEVSAGAEPTTVKVGGTDCRYYYRGFLKHLHLALNDGGALTPLEFNAIVLRRFQGYARRHWRLCRLDAWRRQQGLTVPHVYRCAGDEGCVGTHLRCRAPSRIPLGMRDAWLERTVGPIDPNRDGETDRVQAMIDEWLSHDLREHETRLQNSVNHDLLDSAGLPFSLEHEWSQGGLAAAVAEEKAATPHRQRRTIAALGPDGIRDLVQTIFADMVADRYHPSEVAKRFGLHKSTLTRFAAAHWEPDQPGSVPDLWQNTAQILASQPCFVAAVEEAGLLEVIADLASRPTYSSTNGCQGQV